MNKDEILIQKTKAALEATKALSLDALIQSFEDTDGMKGPEVPTVRGWLMDELDRRNPDAFSAWMETTEDSPRRFFQD